MEEIEVIFSRTSSVVESSWNKGKKSKKVCRYFFRILSLLRKFIINIDVGKITSRRLEPLGQQLLQKMSTCRGHELLCFGIFH